LFNDDYGKSYTVKPVYEEWKPEVPVEEAPIEKKL
jgi:hypothetical protein